MSREFIRPDDDDPPEPDLNTLAKQYKTTVPQRRIRLLEVQHDQQTGLILKVGNDVPDYYGRRPGTIVIAILGDEPYCVVCRKPSSTRDEEPIYVGRNATQRVEFEE